MGHAHDTAEPRPDRLHRAAAWQFLAIVELLLEMRRDMDRAAIVDEAVEQRSG